MATLGSPIRTTLRLPTWERTTHPNPPTEMSINDTANETTIHTLRQCRLDGQTMISMVSLEDDGTDRLGHVNNTRYLDFADMATNYYLSIYRITQSSNGVVENCKLDPLSTTDPIALAVNTVANYFEPVSFRISLQFRGFANL